MEKYNDIKFKECCLMHNIFFSLLICIFAVQSLLANNNSNESKSDTDIQVEELIHLLADNVEKRRAESIKNSLLDNKAPPLAVKQWLNSSGIFTEWPPNKFTMLYFWSSRCNICLDGNFIDRILKWSTEVVSKGGVFISIHPYLSETSKLQQILKDKHINFCVGVDSYSDKSFWNSLTFEAYGAIGTPQFVTIGADGRVISYKLPNQWNWQKIIDEEPAAIKADTSNEVRPLTVIPERWNVEMLEAHLSLVQSFFLYRSDTPELNIVTLRSSNPNVKMTYKKYSNLGQTVFVLYGSTTSPMWGKILKSIINIEVEYAEHVHTLEIPITIAAKPLLANSPPIDLGIVERDKEIIKSIVIRSNVPREHLQLNVINIPSEFTIELPELLEAGCGEIPIKIHFQSHKIGTQKGVVELKAIYNEGFSEQLVGLKYIIIVRN